MGASGDHFVTFVSWATIARTGKGKPCEADIPYERHTHTHTHTHAHTREMAQNKHGSDSNVPKRTNTPTYTGMSRSLHSVPLPRTHTPPPPRTHHHPTTHTPWYNISGKKIKMSALSGPVAAAVGPIRVQEKEATRTHRNDTHTEKRHGHTEATRTYRSDLLFGINRACSNSPNGS